MSLQDKLPRPEELGWPDPPDPAAIMLEFEHVPDQVAVRSHIQACEGNHTQQAIYSTYHDALTQVCYGCRKVRSTIPVR